MSKLPHITVCVCTYRRRELLRRLLEKLSGQVTEDRFSYTCVVVDNDREESARELVSSFQKDGALRLEYAVEPDRNFATVRNRAVQSAQGEFIAFIDDDEVPVEDWLLRLFLALNRFQADGVLGPVRPYFDEDPPDWIIKGRLCERPAHQTGLTLDWNQTRTGNVLLCRALFEEGKFRFDPAYRTGGEDVDFFRRAIKAGHRFVWCEEAPAYELVPPERCRKSYFLKRALLQGRISLKYAADRPGPATALLIGCRSALALLAYTLALPFLLCAGFHHCMKYLIKDCHHLGRLLAILGLSPVRERDF